ncbi:ferrous iron transport protein B [Megalodesulfovibrio gigas]|uniref:Ferrous iron transport protein B n=1 Tax=Megalodesulfovibrio gigas (strain ATCC 19364 / DSM 1382 / NCIMB 9332 / VKM B-1759) TaxID=1121448 RepID=T2G8R5_MEGG1|nr:ferrous iron transport protein B [Megalodesulfovibrio gigas]AGW12526.1 putative small GTP-binding protein [Megalodesulfovibrio gigas DSM 1382 = ATCC 19364]
MNSRIDDESATAAHAVKSYLLVALAGQQNAGKSTVFNMLTGASQYVANYPGVTVEKKSGRYKDGEMRVEVVDLPGTYSLTSFSLEERVARDFLLQDKPDCIANIMDASNLSRSLMLTLQLLELNRPVVLGLNMMDVAQAHGIHIDADRLSSILEVPAVPLVGRKNMGRKELVEQVAIAGVRGQQRTKRPLEYGPLEETVVALEQALHQNSRLGAAYPLRWMAVKLLEQDEMVRGLVRENHPDADAILEQVDKAAAMFEQAAHLSVADHILACRHARAQEIVQQCINRPDGHKATFSERIDRVLLHRILAPMFLVLTVYCIYQVSIVQGYELTKYTWPYLASLRGIVGDLLPIPGLLEDGLLRALVLWCVDSANTLLNYLPIFFILFALIAMLEDSGYMARIAFILDRIFQRFGLHGQSTLPFILGGVFAGGCAVPGIMATKGIPDERSRMATILTVPYMNCLAKVPLYTLLVNIFFPGEKSFALFFISTVTILMALIIAWILTHTVLRSRESAPFVMEMPTYHLPTVRGVATRTLQRTWEYIQKVGTIVLAVSVCVFALLQFPNLPQAVMATYEQDMEQAYESFQQAVQETQFAGMLADRQTVLELMHYSSRFTAARLNAGSGMDKVLADYAQQHQVFFNFLKPGKKEKDERTVGTAVGQLMTTRKELQRAIKDRRIENSFFGRLGRALEPVTQFAGFDWKINIALVSSFAARESSVATLGVLFQQGADEGGTLEARMGAESTESGMTPLHALALIVFFALYPPCFAATIMVKVQTGSYKWMLFAILFPSAVGILVASAIFSLGTVLGVTGFVMMQAFYVLMFCIALGLGLFAGRSPVEAIGDSLRHQRIVPQSR